MFSYLSKFNSFSAANLPETCWKVFIIAIVIILFMPLHCCCCRLVSFSIFFVAFIIFKFVGCNLLALAVPFIYMQHVRRTLPHCTPRPTSGIHICPKPIALWLRLAKDCEKIVAHKMQRYALSMTNANFIFLHYAHATCNSYNNQR